MLQLDEKHRVSVDSSRQNLQLEQLQDIRDRKTKEITKQDWIIIGYHGLSLRSVLLQYQKEALITGEKLETINDVFDRLREIEKTIEKVAKQVNIVFEVKSND